MNPEDKIKKLINESKISSDAQTEKKILGDAMEQIDKLKQQKSPLAGSYIWRIIKKSPMTKLAAAAVIAIVVLSGVTFWPGGHPENDKWWLGSTAAWGQEILAALDTIKGVTCREQTIWTGPDGSRHTSSTWDIFYISSDSYRRDIYDGDVLRETQWYVPDGNGTLHHSIRYDLNSYFTHTGEGNIGDRDPVERMRFYVRYLDEADELLGEKVIEDHNCVGFEISASKYGSNPEEWLDRIWFDAETKLLVMIERDRPCPQDKTQTDYHPHIDVQDQFNYNPELPADTFTPWVPEGYINAHPDDIEAAGEEEQQK